MQKIVSLWSFIPSGIYILLAPSSLVIPEPSEGGWFRFVQILTVPLFFPLEVIKPLNNF